MKKKNTACHKALFFSFLFLFLSLTPSVIESSGTNQNQEQLLLKYVIITTFGGEKSPHKWILHTFITTWDERNGHALLVCNNIFVLDHSRNPLTGSFLQGQTWRAAGNPLINQQAWSFNFVNTRESVFHHQYLPRTPAFWEEHPILLTCNLRTWSRLRRIAFARCVEDSNRIYLLDWSESFSDKVAQIAAVYKYSSCHPLHNVLHLSL